jgi:Zn-dependent M16 (insulinase) family peptidase
LDALLHPDYTDEEIRREVRNFGVAGNAADKTLRLEEKGTVYNEMVSTMDQAISRVYRTSNVMVYGERHPLAYNSGGSPEALRMLQPADIRKFHRENYRLANMGMIASLPKGVALDDTLRRIDALLGRVGRGERPRRATSERDLPPPAPAPAGQIRIVEYPHRNDQQPGPAWMLWPADRDLDRTDETLLELFLGNVAGDPTTNLYKRLIDSRTRERDFGIKSMYSEVSEEIGHPVLIGFGDLPAAQMNERDLGALRAIVRDELDRIAAMPDGSPELAAFNARMQSRLIDARRRLSKFVNSPPAFGFRRSGAEWLIHLHALGKSKEFRKSLTLKPELAAVGELLTADRNVWKERLARWKLTGTTPMIIAAKPDPTLLARDQEERGARVKAEVERLKRQYATADEQEAIRRYRVDYDAGTAVIDRATAATRTPKFVANPPLTLDDQLDYRVSKLPGDVPLVASTFDSMTGATTGIALRLDGVPADQRMYLPVLPALLTRVGVVDDGRAIPYDEMSERLKNEILSLNASFATNAAKGRVELVVRGAGNDAAEATRALEWMRRAMFRADWRRENLPRIRDVVDQALVGSRRVMQQGEESWVQGPATAYWKQTNPVLLTIESFMTQGHDLLRLSWMLKEASDDERKSVADLLKYLGAVRGTRAEYRALIAEVQGGASQRTAQLGARAKTLATEAMKDLDAALPDIPDSSVADDWGYLCSRIAADLVAGPDKALADLDAMRRIVMTRTNARMFVVGASSTQAKLSGGIATLVGELAPGVAWQPLQPTAPIVRSRLRERDASALVPTYVGLVNPNSQSGVFLLSAPLVGYADTDEGKLLDYLSTKLYGGRGAHGVFMKTWAAGLAYSNGMRARPAAGRLSYDAERTPELPQTLRFVIDTLRAMPRPDAGLIEYAIAEAFSESRAGAQFEARGEAIAADLADGQAPDVVARFRRTILAFRERKDVPDALASRMRPVYATVLPGAVNPAPVVDDAVYMVIGPERQLGAWETYLQATVGPDAKLHRLYPRDFWVAAP